jgi:phosphoenolpyruvate carboxykinase (ATP)
MHQIGPRISRFTIENHGIRNPTAVYWNLPAPALYEEAIRRREAILCHDGPLAVRTGHHTGRSPGDKVFVREPGSEEDLWWGDINLPIEPARFETLYGRLRAYLQMKDVFVQDLHACANPRHRLKVRVITEYAWHSLFVRNLLLVPPDSDLEGFVPDLTIIDVPRFHAVPELDGTKSEVFIAVDLSRRLVLIGGTSYAGEMKKSVFTALNYLLPLQGVLPMHCSANVGPAGDSALFFGLSGTGKTTLSADPRRRLIGDDEHGWDDEGVFNFEGGCYAKVIRLSPQDEPEIFATTRRFGTVLENTVVDTDSRVPDLDDDALTENTRAAYPLSHLGNTVLDGRGAHPRHIVFLTADAFGVMPPIARLTREQAMYHFLSGYTARVAGTEKGVSDPKAVFSACFGAPFLPLPPARYAQLLGEKLTTHGSTVWLVNTGWTGGPYGVGKRMRIGWTRAMIDAALTGRLDEGRFEPDPVFGLALPADVPGVPREVLRPRNTWANGADHDAQASRVAEMFVRNFVPFHDQVGADVRACGPRPERN